jgi:5-methylcytosine-specific restriction endonuclease McrA
MKNLKVFNDEAFTFYKDVIDGKNTTAADPTYKTRLEALKVGIEERYGVYDDEFKKDRLQDIAEKTYTEAEKNDLLALYRFKAKILVRLKVKLTTLPNNRVHNICQNCTISEVNSFDHYLPKDLFPDFAVHPKNLVPSCTFCNARKSKAWQDQGKRLFINPYLDQLPIDQILFATIQVTNKTDLAIKFAVDNRNGIPADLYEMIAYHYSKLGLCSRFSDSCEVTIDGVEQELKKYAGKLPLDEVRAAIIENAQESRQTFGANHFIHILEEALARSDEFIRHYVGIAI